MEHGLDNMTAEQFYFWLRGYFDSTSLNCLTENDIKNIREKLDTVQIATEYTGISPNPILVGGHPYTVTLTHSSTSSES